MINSLFSQGSRLKSEVPFLYLLALALSVRFKSVGFFPALLVNLYVLPQQLFKPRFEGWLPIAGIRTVRRVGMNYR
jgi:hypothetical protein